MQTITRRNNWRTLSDSEIEKAHRTAHRNHYYAVYVSGLYVDNKAVKRMFKVSRWIYNHVEYGDRALVIK